MGGTIGTPGGHERVLGLMCEVCECVVSVCKLDSASQGDVKVFDSGELSPHRPGMPPGMHPAVPATDGSGAATTGAAYR